MLSVAARSMASPFMRTAIDEARSSRAWSSACSRSSRTRSRRNWNGRVTARLLGSLDGLLTGAGQLFEIRALALGQGLHTERPLAVDEHQPAGAEMAPVHEQVGRLVGLAVEVDDRALGHANDERGRQLGPADLGPHAQRHVEQRSGLELVEI